MANTNIFKGRVELSDIMLYSDQIVDNISTILLSGISVE